MNGISATFDIKVPVDIIRRGTVYVACCPILDVHSQGKNEAEAIENIRDAVNLFLVSCYERGVLDKALKECGFNPRTESADMSSRAAGMKIIDVPLQLIPSGAAVEQCHV